jgi:glycogen debranching enzyme
MTDWASMDNSPRVPYLANGGTAIDTSSQMVLFGQQLAEMAEGLGKPDDVKVYRQEAAELSGLINEKMWNPEEKFCFDLKVDGQHSPVKTIAAYWTLLAGVASPEQADALAAELENPSTFGRKHRVPTTPADEKGFDPKGGYWRGAVWSPTNTMVVRGLERYAKHDLANEIALEHLGRVAEVFQATGTVWENYAPDATAPGKPAKPDFVGWTGIVPILYLLEYGIGLKPDAPNNSLTWTLTSDKRCGCQRFRFGGHVTTLVAEPSETQPDTVSVKVESDGAFDLRIERGGNRWDFKVEKGTNDFVLK